MSEFFFQIFILILFHLHCAHQQLTLYDEGQAVSISCTVKGSGSTVFWFRVLRNGMDFIGSFNADGTPKVQYDTSIFDYIKSNKLTVKSFRKKRDGGTYSCVSINANKLIFGEPTVIEGHPDPIPTVKATPKTTLSTTTRQVCSCPTLSKAIPSVGCQVLVWAPMAAACGLLFLILILTICHCNRIRTRRCPHHYRRKPKNNTPARQAMADRYT
ncbi:T-cell surface glycoprotein CD8 alpha chain [Scleropages formosus]|uniref:T-cell surface glycoprotein CD8 alpha chain n=1 Tax=Scleropages formosus TaxID=113540 RepID=A0A8C9RY43_SCLFO|nr:T-cell surface glycoprotein CD8 alpha chain [Scleropages formosus]